MSAEHSREKQYTFHDEPPFDKLVGELSKERGSTKFLVFDNLEQVSSDNEIIRGIARLVIRLDNPRFALSGVRFIFVGVVSDMKHIVSSHDQSGSVANRLVELPEVARLEDQQSESLLDRGFTKLKN